MNNVLLQIKNLSVHFPLYKGLFFRRLKGTVKAVNDVTFSVKEGETFGLVGESGCGKSTTAKAIMQIVPSTKGQIIFNNVDLMSLDKKAMQDQRKNLQMIFQDPYASLNPRMTVFDIVSEPLKTFKVGDKVSIKNRVKELLDLVGLDKKHIKRYPHEFSGGQRQRVGIARAMALNPKLILADEPISALDVSIQAQVLNLLVKLQKELSLTYIFIAHDLAAVRHISDRICVMYLGRIAELQKSETIYTDPKHPYTKALISAVPIPDPKVEGTRKRILLKGEIPSPINPPNGCLFHPRCPERIDVCDKEEPKLKELNKGTHVACHLY